jgi:hypothetical protein
VGPDRKGLAQATHKPLFDRISRRLGHRAYYQCKKGKWDGTVSGVVGRRQSSDLIWTLWLSSEQGRAGASKPLAVSCIWPVSGTHTQSGHALFRWHLMLFAAPCHICNVSASFPQSPLLRIINKQDGSLCHHLARAVGRIYSHNRKSCSCH